MAIASIVLTLLLSWRLEGGAAAINDAGSLRMQTYRLGLLIHEGTPEEKVRQKIHLFDTTLRNIQRGNPSRPLFLPGTPEVQQRMALLQSQWQHQIKPAFQAALTQHQTVNNLQLQQFVASIDDLVFAVEAVNARYTEWLRIFQTGLMVLVLVSAAVMMVLLYLWIIKPLQALQSGVSAIHDGNLGVQVQRDSSTEFAEVDDGFNQMSVRLQQLYAHLEQEVAEKTRDLADKNYTLETLYAFTRLLNQAKTVTEAAQEFLDKIMVLAVARAGSIRLIDSQRERMDLIAHQGLPETLRTADACTRLDECFCGHSIQGSGWQPIYFDDKTRLRAITDTGCERMGFQFLHIFQIRYNGQDLGVMTLYFSDECGLTTATAELLNTLCHQLGVVVTNIRLVDESRQLAVLQERNLMAQGLHDSIAQTLTFLNLQVQMLDSALIAGEQEQISENLRFIKSGVQECYEDVRELLLNFRTKISRKEFTEAVQALAARFEQQTRVATRISWYGDGPPLNAEQQLQFIFILQESLSNIRKHAQARLVQIQFDNWQDFVMTIRDDGCGFDANCLTQLSDSHVGLGIMRERAGRIQAVLTLDSQPGNHTQIRLTLPYHERNLA